MSQELLTLLKDALDDLKGQEITVVDVRGKSDVTDTLLIVSGTSNRHVRSLANYAVEQAKKANQPPMGVEGQDGSDWVLADFGDIVLHVMLPETRQFYDLEKLWSVEPAGRQSD